MATTKLIWTTREGRQVKHSMGCRCTVPYARDWWRQNILECQGILSQDEARKPWEPALEIVNAIIEEN